MLLLFSSKPISQFLAESAHEQDLSHFLMWALELFLQQRDRKEGEGGEHQAFPGAIFHCLLLLCSVILLVVHSFCWSSSLRRNFFKKTVWGFFFLINYILILQNRNYFILIVYYSSTFVEAQKNDASLNFSNYRSIYVTIYASKNKSICVHVYIIYIHIYIYTHTIYVFLLNVFLRF